MMYCRDIPFCSETLNITTTATNTSNDVTLHHNIITNATSATIAFSATPWIYYKLMLLPIPPPPHTTTTISAAFTTCTVSHCTKALSLLNIFTITSNSSCENKGVIPGSLNKLTLNLKEAEICVERFTNNNTSGNDHDDNDNGDNERMTARECSVPVQHQS